MRRPRDDVARTRAPLRMQIILTALTAPRFCDIDVVTEFRFHALDHALDAYAELGFERVEIANGSRDARVLCETGARGLRCVARVCNGVLDAGRRCRASAHAF